MALGYAAMAFILALMVVWMAVRYRALRGQQDEIARLEAEIRANLLGMGYEI